MSGGAAQHDRLDGSAQKRGMDDRSLEGAKRASWRIEGLD